jgi:hypothetical protein
MLRILNRLVDRQKATLFLLLIVGSTVCLHGQTGKTPEDRVKGFYTWYLTAINNEQDPSKNKVVMNTHLSRRLSRSFYSKAGQNLDYDIFVNGQDWNEAWADNIVIGELSTKGLTATLSIILGSPNAEWDMPLTIALVKEAGTWKIDRVKGR